jgi:glutamate-1-semialdehyde 2,1-aminomutase
MGKALGNGFPVSAILGRRAVMEAAQGTFISSTFWSERVGFVAALEVIRQFENDAAGERLQENGIFLKNRLREMFQSLGLKVDLVGMDAAPTLAIKEENPLLIKTVFTQEMLKKGYLASNLSYMSIAHNRENLSQYVDQAHGVFGTIKKQLENGTLKSMLEGPICHSGFARLT